AQQGKAADRFWLQAGSFTSPNEAENLKARLALAGWEAAVQEADVPDKGVRYRVRLGPFDNTDELNRMKGELARRGFDVEVIKFFSYGCPHCADLEPFVEDWLKTLPPDVQFRRVPVLFQPRWVSLARVYYTLEALGVDTKLTPEVFSAVHKQGIDLANDK